MCSDVNRRIYSTLPSSNNAAACKAPVLGKSNGGRLQKQIIITIIIGGNRREKVGAGRQSQMIVTVSAIAAFRGRGELLCYGV